MQSANARRRDQDICGSERQRVREDEPEEVTGFQSFAMTYRAAQSAPLESSREPLDSLQQ